MHLTMVSPQQKEVVNFTFWINPGNEDRSCCCGNCRHQTCNRRDDSVSIPKTKNLAFWTKPAKSPLNPKFKSVGYFSAGLAWAKLDDGKLDLLTPKVNGHPTCLRHGQRF
jgi:hypothetical protein